MCDDNFSGSVSSAVLVEIMVVEANGFTIGGVPVSTSNDTYWEPKPGSKIVYAGPVGVGYSSGGSPEGMLMVGDNKVGFDYDGDFGLLFVTNGNPNASLDRNGLQEL